MCIQAKQGAEDGECEMNPNGCDDANSGQLITAEWRETSGRNVCCALEFSQMMNLFEDLLGAMDPQTLNFP